MVLGLNETLAECQGACGGVVVSRDALVSNVLYQVKTILHCFDTAVKGNNDIGDDCCLKDEKKKQKQRECQIVISLQNKMNI